MEINLVRDLQSHPENKPDFSAKELDNDSTIIDKSIIPNYTLISKIAPLTSNLISKYRGISVKDNKKVIVKLSLHSSALSILTKFLNEWHILGGIHEIIAPNKRKAVDGISDYVSDLPYTLPKNIKGILYPIEFIFNKETDSTALIYDNEEIPKISLKEKYIINSYRESSPAFFNQETSSTSSIKSMTSFNKLDFNRQALQRSKLQVLELIDIFIEILKILQKIHNYGVVNNGLSSNSIFIEEKNSSKVYISGFGLAFSLLTEDCTKGFRMRNRDYVKDLLPYISPESSGEFNRLADFRSDFYSLGIIMYELFLGFLPFDYSDSSQIIYMHVNQTPLDPSSIAPWLPVKLCSLIMKCLAKRASERFRSGNEIINSLLLIKRELTTVNNVDSIIHARPKLVIPKDIYGRNNEIEELITKYESMERGKINGLMVTGESGVGKTMMLDEFKSYLTSRKFILHASWKCNKFQQASSIHQIFVKIIRTALKRILTTNKKFIKKWRDLIIKNIDDLTIATDIFPEIKDLLGQKFLQSLSLDSHHKFNLDGRSPSQVLPLKLESRFTYIIKKLFALFASNANEGFTIIVDDTQYLSKGEVKLFDEIVSFIVENNYLPKSKLIFVFSKLSAEGQKDNNENLTFVKSQTAPLEKYDDQSYVKIERVWLGKLSFEGVEEYSRELLPDNFNNSSKGFIDKTLYDEFLYNKTPNVLRYTMGMLLLNGAFGLGDDDYSLIFKYENAISVKPNSLVDFFNYYTKSYSDKNTLKVLRFASCISTGYSFSLSSLAIVSGMSLKDTYTYLYPSLSILMIFPTTVNYKFPFHLIDSSCFPAKDLSEDDLWHLASNCSFKFCHDSLQDYLLNTLVDTQQFKKYQKLCALRLYESVNVDFLTSSKLFEMCRHFIDSSSIAEEHEFPIYRHVLTLAGKLAYLSYDFELALIYFETVREYFTRGNNLEDSNKQLDLTVVQLYYILKRYEKCLQLIDDYIPTYPTPYEKNLFLLTRTKTLFMLHRHDEAIRNALSGLKMLNIIIEEDDEWNDKFLEEVKPRIPLSIGEIHTLKNISSISIPAEKELEIETISNLIVPVLASGRLKLANTLTSVNIINMLTYGSSSVYAVSLLVLAISMTQEHGKQAFMRAIEYSKVALSLVEKDKNVSLETGVIVYELYFVTLAIFAEPLQHVMKYYDVFISQSKSFIDNGISFSQFIGIGIKNFCNLLTGENLNAILFKAEMVKFDFEAEQATSQSLNVWNSLHIKSIKCLIGSIPLDELVLEESDEPNSFIYSEYAYAFHVIKFYSCVAIGEYSKAMQIFEVEIPKFKRMFPLTLFDAAIAFFGCILLLKDVGNNARKKSERKKVFEEYYEYLETWSLTSPSTFESKFLIVKAISAHIYNIGQQSDIEILDLFEKAAELAASKYQYFDEALAYESCSLWLLQISKNKDRAAKFMKEAARVYHLWGSNIRVQKLVEEYPELLCDYNWAGVENYSSIKKAQNFSSSTNASESASVKAINLNSSPLQMMLSSYFKNEISPSYLPNARIDSTISSSDEDYDSEHVDDAIMMSQSSSDDLSIDMKTAIQTCLDISESIDSGSIVLKLIKNTMNILNADFAVLALKDNIGEVYVEAAATESQVRLISHEPLSSRNDLCPISLINDVIKFGTTINREDDPIYFSSHYRDIDFYYNDKPGNIAILGIPIKNQTETIGALYMENQEVRKHRSYKIFTKEKVDLGTLFCTQAAFSLDKAMLYQQMNHATKLAKEATEEKASFLNSMSHEIRTPFNSLLSCSIFLLDTDLTDIQKEYVETIRSSAMVTLNIIDGILSFAKIENSLVTLDNIPFSLNDCIESALQLVCEQASSKDLELVYLNRCDSVDTIIGDVTRFRQIIINIIGNAVKFTNKGYILVETNCRKVSSDDRYQFTVTIKDTGIGIPKDSYNKVFGAFSQVDGSSRRMYGGAGLGLAISKKLVDLMGGSLTFESIENIGTSFYFSVIAKVQLQNQQKLETRTKAFQDILNSNETLNKQILIADSYKLGRLALKEELERFGFEVTITDNLEDTLKIFKEKESKDDGFKIVFINNKLLNSEEDEEIMNFLNKKFSSKTVFILSGQFGTVNAKGFSQILLLPFQRFKIQEILTKTYVQDKNLDLEEKKTLGRAAEIVSKKENNATFDKTLLETLADRHPLKILLAEDNMINTKVALQHLKRMGYKADHAKDGVEVLKKCASTLDKTGTNYDVVLMDIQMPNKDGIAACLELNEIYKDNHMPKVVALTANVAGEDKERCLACGMVGFISKPLLPNDLAAVLMSIETT
ncbi:hypothetical protein PACTADRAFT_41849 [Pachysolen tannophilus NRRL Y-2460]|uniref:Histidine kinase n=1 Tax=Pachysolen tannophilus NRRL Y-2460 TaxID=669874 RepID=A0A1E4TWQ0_PACTA|nr:hypothetical protein PACTADRAFT_41849 [Pachysolen tannophilus NRRL Y-2460]